jgi:hypothetical protein
MSAGNPLCGAFVNGDYCRTETTYNEGGYDCRACGKRWITADSILRFIDSRKGLRDAFERMLRRASKVTPADMRTVVDL